ncbi:MAG: helix-turn-helix domain-containing protein [Ruminococcaceae bacterium]|nr:helix-turn-helix domain-containing protein [Oscillospiraceae bacterium]
MELEKTGAFIRSERIRLGLSQSALGKKLSVTDKAVSKWERGSGCPDVETLQALASLFGCTVQNILEGSARTAEPTSMNEFARPSASEQSAGESEKPSYACARDHLPAKLLILTEGPSDFTKVLESCGADITFMTMEEAIGKDLTVYDAFCILAYRKVLDPRLRVPLEAEAAKGKRFFTEALGSFLNLFSDAPADTTRRRLAVVQPEDPDRAVPGFETGDLLDDMSNATARPFFPVPGMTPLLVYRDHILAHRHWNAPREEILKDSGLGLWLVGENVMMCSFTLHNFNKARFAPRDSWLRLIAWIAEWITGSASAFLPEPVVKYGTDRDLTDDAVFEECRRDAVERGIRWLRQFLVDKGAGGIREGIRHNIDPEGRQMKADEVRNDCTGESAGAFNMYARLTGNEEMSRIADRMREFIFGSMMINGGLFDGMIRWTDTAWVACYQDDVARSILPVLLECNFMGDDRRFPEVCRALDFLVKTTAKDGCRVPRTDIPNLSEEAIRALCESEHGVPTAHHNAYYHAALLLAYRFGKNPVYLDTARRGIETIMAVYPETRREQSETQEFCRLILPLAMLYEATGEEKHLAMLERVTRDLLSHRHPSGGFAEWDTGYTAHYSRISTGECSLLTENGDPVADLLYSMNWLPVGFAYAFYATGDPAYRDLWRETAEFLMKAQIRSDDPLTNGSWCRAFDMDLGEAYGCPHDVGWAAYCSETGWTDAEILMGFMLPELLEQSKRESK